MALPEAVLAYKFLNNANITEQHKQLVRATLSELRYDKMKEQIKKAFSDPISEVVGDESSIKVETCRSGLLLW